MDEPIRIFVGCSANNEDLEAYAVLEWSIRKHTRAPADIIWMRLSHKLDDPFYIGCWGTENWATPFSGLRWSVPDLCERQGRAIYVDYDFIFFDDIAKLWQEPLPELTAAISTGNNRFCIMLMNCEWAPLVDTDDPLMHSTMIRMYRKSVSPFTTGDWNCLDGAGYPDLYDKRPAALHYTSMNHQPHLEYALPRLAREGAEHWFDGPVEKHWRPDVRMVFAELLHEAIANGYDPENYRVSEPFGAYRKRSFAV